jgi:hypothetical protein
MNGEAQINPAGRPAHLSSMLGKFSRLASTATGLFIVAILSGALAWAGVGGSIPGTVKDL